MGSPLSGCCPGRVMRRRTRAIGLARSDHGRGGGLPNRNAVLLGQALGQLGERGCVGALDERQRLCALLGLAPIRDDPNQHVARGGCDGRVRCCSRVR